MTGLTAEDWAAGASTPGIRTYEYPPSLQCLIMLNNQRAPFDNPKVRQALAYAANYDDVINGIIGGHATKLDSVVGPGSIGYTPAATQYGCDLDKAKALLAEAGAGDGLSPDGPDLDARGARSRLRPDGPQQGTRRAAGGPPPRPPQRAAADADLARSPPRRAAGRRLPGRGRLHLPRPRHVRARLDPARRVAST